MIVCFLHFFGRFKFIFLFLKHFQCFSNKLLLFVQALIYHSLPFMQIGKIFWVAILIDNHCQQLGRFKILFVRIT